VERFLSWALSQWRARHEQEARAAGAGAETGLDAAKSEGAKVAEAAGGVAA
jgi:hypothetical protein